MEKRYQVFISSTYEDLKEERAKVIQVLWELDCIPYGMEVFPATNSTSWDWIEKAIGESDYFILIVGGKYGSIHKESGVSFTQKEYELAKKKGVPGISFLVADESDLPKRKTEDNPKIQMKLDQFREVVRGDKNCRFYFNPDDLSKQVSTSLQRLIKDNPRDGWIRASSVESYKTHNPSENGDHKKNSSKLRELPDGEKEKIILYSYDALDGEKLITKTDAIALDWNRIFYEIASYLFNARSYEGKYAKNLLEYIRKEAQIEDRWMNLKSDIDELMLFLMARNCLTQNNYNEWKLTLTGKKYYARLQEKYSDQ